MCVCTCVCASVCVYECVSVCQLQLLILAGGVISQYLCIPDLDTPVHVGPCMYVEACTFIYLYVPVLVCLHMYFPL